MNWQESSMEIRGLNIAYRYINTNGEKTASNKIIALHGWLDNAASFDTLAPLINDCEIIAVDLPGHGLSDHRHQSSSYSFQEYIFDLYEVINFCKSQFDWQEIVLMGHSMGSVVISLFSSGYKAKITDVEIKQLIYFDFIGTLVETPDHASNRISESLQSYRRLKSMPNQSYQSLDEAINARLRKSDMRQQDAKLIMQRNLQEKEDRYFWRFDKRLMQTSANYFTPDQTANIMQGITIDLLVIGGRNSRFIEPIRERINLYQNDKRTIDFYEFDGGHYVHMEQAEKCAEVINEILNNK